MAETSEAKVGRIYAVETANELTLVRSVSAAQALQHVVKEQYKVRTATPDDVETYMELGGKIEVAGIKVGTMEIPDPALKGEKPTKST